MIFQEDDIQKIAHLAKLTLNKEDNAQFTEQLSSIVSYVSKLDSLVTSDTPPTIQVMPLQNRLREDTVFPTSALGTPDELISCSEQHKDMKQIRVPNILD